MDDLDENITAIVGNGFDIALLKSIGGAPNQLTTFSSFYNWLTQRHFESSNLIFAELKKRKLDGDVEWDNVEKIIADTISDNNGTSNVLNDVEIIRQQLSLFINEIVTPEKLIEISELSQKDTLGKQTFASFAADLSTPLEGFSNRWKENHKRYHWKFFNLNYTSILENYFWIVLDPHPFKSSNNNFQMNPIPGDNWKPFVQLDFEFFHPHGFQNIPSSILLGSGNLKNVGEGSWKYDKTYAGKITQKYEPFIKNTQLFIIFGTSLGESDEYWWNCILTKLMTDDECELIIYWYQFDNKSETDIIEKFIKVSGINKEEIHESVEDRIRVILFSDEKPLKYGFKVK